MSRNPHVAALRHPAAGGARAAAAGLLVLSVLLAAICWRLDPRVLLGAYLAIWWLVAGALLGGLANVWLHQLTGGAWGLAIRPALLRAARWLPLACLLFLPVLAGMRLLYPWTTSAALEPATPFRSAWLSVPVFTLRSLAYLLLWSGLAWLETRAPRRSSARAAVGLLLYGFSVSLAAVDWIMSLQPAWYSSVFGWLAATGQMLAGLALALLLTDRRAAHAVLPDLANLLLMYVLCWAYLAYVQFLIIWAADLPREIGWYLRRSAPGWQAVAWMLFGLHGALPAAILLSRRAKRAPALMGALAGVLLLAHLLDCGWLVLPSVQGVTQRGLGLAAALAACCCVLAWLALRAAHGGGKDGSGDHGGGGQGDSRHHGGNAGHDDAGAHNGNSGSSGEGGHG